MVMVVLADHCGKETREAHCSLDFLVRATHKSVRAVQYALRELEHELMEISTVRRGNGRANVAIYKIHHLPLKGATVAPFTATERVQLATKKGATSDMERVQPSTVSNSVSLSVYPLLEDADASAFESMWAIYPERFGSNPKRAACRCWQARRKEGHTADEIRQGVERYRAHCTARGEINTEFVMQAKRFFGVEKEFLKPWSTKRSPAKPSSEKILCACGEPYVARYAGTPCCARCYRDKAAVDLPGAAATRP